MRVDNNKGKKELRIGANRIKLESGARIPIRKSMQVHSSTMQSNGWDLRHDDNGSHKTQEARDADLGVARSCAGGRRSAAG
jgi:hypothetical protein